MSKKGQPYDMVTVLLGYNNTVLGNKLPDSAYEKLKEGDEVEVIVHVSIGFGSLRGDIVALKPVK